MGVGFAGEEFLAGASYSPADKNIPFDPLIE
jgi:hypothetical protein